MKIPALRYFALLLTYLKPQWHRTLLLAVVLLISTGLQLFNPQLLKSFIDTALAGGAVQSLVTAALLFIALALVIQGITVCETYLSESIAWTATNALRIDLVAHCLSLDMTFHNERTSGELVERIDGDVNTLSNFFSQFALQLLGNGILLIGILFVFFRVAWQLGLVMTVLSLTYIYILMLLRRPIIPLWVQQREIDATFYGFLSERLSGTEDIRANGATASIMRRFYLLLRDWYPVTRKSRMAGTVMVIISFAMISGIMALALLLGAYLRGINPSITVGSIFSLYSYTFMLLRPVWSIQTQLQDLQQSEACIQRIEALFHRASKLEERNRLIVPAVLPKEALAVAFERVTFGYVAEVPVLRDVSFRVEPGKVLGVLGRTGSGKTTLARLLFRLYDPQAGVVRVGEVETKEVQLHDLRAHIGLVTQDVQLFHASVRDNITFFNPAISDAQIVRVIDDSGLTSWYQKLPQGLDTVLGTDAMGLSAGEAQLLTLMRVFLSDPGLVILDEASSRLDPMTEALLERAMEKLFSGRTVIIIAHRLATVRRTDHILVLDEGRVLEYGPTSQLAKDTTSRYYQLLQTGLEEVQA